jgi:hypothetical protein
MKVVFTLIFIGLLSLSSNAQEFKFEKEIINYGKIPKGDNGERTFVFTNIGDKPLIINNIRSSCGCTVPKKPEGPIMPGKKGEIKVSYDTKRLGGFAKAITIFSNAKNSKKVIKIRGNVYEGVALEKQKSVVSEN